MNALGDWFFWHSKHYTNWAQAHPRRARLSRSWRTRLIESAKRNR